MVPTNVLHAFAGRLNRFRFCSFPEYSADYDVAQHVVGADGERSRQRRRSATDAAYPLRVHIGPANIWHHRRIRRWPVISTAGCFALSLRGNCFRWERCPHAGGAVVQLCREIPVCWPQCSSTGSFCGTAVQSDPHPAPLFAHFFWQDRRNQIANQRSVCNLERTSNGTDETCRLRRGEGCGVCEDEGLRSDGCGATASMAVR